MIIAISVELTSKGELIIMPAAGAKTGWRNSNITQRLAEWTEINGSGVSFYSSTLFTLPDGSKRSRDALRVKLEKWVTLSEVEQETFAPVAPDFVIELGSPTDSWRLLEEKMLDYMRNSVRLAWLIDPGRKRVYVYRGDRAVQMLQNPTHVTADPVLPGFVFDVQEIW